MSTEQEAALSIQDLTNDQRDAIVFPATSQNQKAIDDITTGLQTWRIWLMLAYRDITVRYRRSVLGPFWITLSMAITVYSMGYLYAHLFHIELQRYYPLLVSGMLCWSLIATMVTDATESFVAASGFINQVKLPYTLHIHRIAARNFIIFFHNLIVIVPILVIFHEFAKVNLNTLLIIPGLALVYYNSITFGTLLAMLGGRYRDLTQVIKSLVQVVFFVTPVMWDASILPERVRIFAEFNPFYAFLQLIREPLIGRVPTLTNLLVALAVSALGTLITFKIFSRYRARIVYWL